MVSAVSPRAEVAKERPARTEYRDADAASRWRQEAQQTPKIPSSFRTAGGSSVTITTSLRVPSDCAMLLIDHQAGLAFAVESIGRQTLLNNVSALAETAKVFGIPIIASTSATKVYSGPLMPTIQKIIPDVQAIERNSMNIWRQEPGRAA